MNPLIRWPTVLPLILGAAQNADCGFVPEETEAGTCLDRT